MMLFRRVKDWQVQKPTKVSKVSSRSLFWWRKQLRRQLWGTETFQSENAKLEKETEGPKRELIQAESQNGGKQIPFPSGTPRQANFEVSANIAQPTAGTATSSGPEEKIKGGGEERNKGREKIEKRRCWQLKTICNSCSRDSDTFSLPLSHTRGAYTYRQEKKTLMHIR